MDSREILASSVTFILNHSRAAGSIGFDLTALGKMRGSGTLINVGNSLSSPGNGTNVGDIRRNREFYTKYMIHGAAIQLSSPMILQVTSQMIHLSLIIDRVSFNTVKNRSVFKG